MKDLKTTIVGAVTAGGISVLELIQTGTLQPKTLLLAFGIAILAYLSKDKEGK